MIVNKNAEIIAIGKYIPEFRLSNDDFPEALATSDEWIYTRTGIKERRISKPYEYSSNMAINAVYDLINKGVSVDDVDLIIVSSITPDYFTPSISALVQAEFNIKNTGCLDVNAACSGYVYASQLAYSMIYSGFCNKVLVITSDVLTKITDFEDRKTCVLFGDAATATIIQKNEKRPETAHAFWGTNGELGKELFCSNLNETICNETITSPRVINQNGRALYTFVTREVSDVVNAYLIDNNIDKDEIDWFIPHSANMRMLSKLCEHIDIPEEKLLSSIKFYGNTSSNTIPLSLSENIYNGKIKRGDKLFLLGFGGGFTFSGLVFTY